MKADIRGVMLSALALCVAGTAALAVQEPGDEYIFVLNDANSFCKIDVYGMGFIVDQTPMDGWFTLYLGEPGSGTPKDWDVRCLLGRGDMISLEDIDLIVTPGFFEAFIRAGDLKVKDMDVWYQDPNDWYVDPNWWPDPSDAVDPNDAPDPNQWGDPNNPMYRLVGEDPNLGFDPNVYRWTDLAGGPPVSSGRLNSEILYFWAFEAIINGVVDIDADFTWSDVFHPWYVKLGDANTIWADPSPQYPVQTRIDWKFYISNGLATGTMVLEAVGGKARKLDLQVVKPQYGSVAVDPQVVDPNRCPKYIDGTQVTLTATPIEGKGFGGWLVWSDPTKYPDANYIAIQDSNMVLHLTMDSDYLAEATFKCGSGVEPFIGVALFALVVGVAVRRFW